MAASADIYFEREEWKRGLIVSAVAHSLLFGTLVLYATFFSGIGESWGGGGEGGGALNVNIVNTIPLPARDASPRNIVAPESPGVAESLPETRPKTVPDAVPIPAPDAKKKTTEKPRTATRESDSQRRREPQPVAPNVVPYGQGGPVSGPYSVFSAGGAEGGFAFRSGGGDFGSRYAWYVNVVRRKVSENWLKYEVDPTITSAERVYITFDILRSGEPTNIRLEHSSGIPSLDQSALRALERIDTFGPLPPDYQGGRVSVEFWFDYQR